MKVIGIYIILSWVVLSIAPEATSDASKTNSFYGKLVIEVSNIKPCKGTVQIGIFNQEEYFLDTGKEFKILRLKVVNGLVKGEINLPKGVYAFSVYHDENENKKCDRNLVGIPSEGFAFSNNVKPILSPPTFKSAAFSLNKYHIQKIKMINL